VDSDRDGVLDSADACRFEAGVASAVPALNGCPKDSDRDGLADAVDACPAEAGPAANRGCPLPADRDGDGVVDGEDLCPDERGAADAARKGCPAEKAALKADRIELAEQVTFANNKADILPASEAVLQGVAKVLAAHPELVKVSVDGFTDDRGPAAYNLKLSGDRAAAVVEWLVKSGGIERARLVSKGYGVERPIASNADDAGRQKNRRVEVRVLEYKK
jgi:outer membrane protein OmpA-like peptidoglycan-associated protein